MDTYAAISRTRVSLRRQRRFVMVASLVLAMTLSGTSSASAELPWGACGNSTEESKEATKYSVSGRQYYFLRCGNANYGYRHIVTNHREDFEILAAGTFQNWRELADLTMDTISRDPDAAKPVRDGKACLSRVIFLKNIRTNQVVRQQIFRMIVVVATGDIVTVYPDSRQC